MMCRLVLENVSRHIEAGMTPLAATLLGRAEVRFTVISMSISLVTVFLPMLLLRISSPLVPIDFPWRFRHRTDITRCLAYNHANDVTKFVKPKNSIAVSISPVNALNGCMIAMKPRSGATALKHTFGTTLLVMLAVVVLNVYLYTVVPKGFFRRTTGSGRLQGSIQADQATSLGHATETAGLRRYRAPRR